MPLGRFFYFLLSAQQKLIFTHPSTYKNQLTPSTPLSTILQPSLPPSLLHLYKNIFIHT